MERIQLTQAEREELNRWARGQSNRAAQSRRARLILLINAGERFNVIRSKLGCDTNFIARWKSRFLADRMAGLRSRHTGRLPGKDRGPYSEMDDSEKAGRWFDTLEPAKTG